MFKFAKKSTIPDFKFVRPALPSIPSALNEQEQQAIRRMLNYEWPRWRREDIPGQYCRGHVSDDMLFYRACSGSGASVVIQISGTFSPKFYTMFVDDKQVKDLSQECLKFLVDELEKTHKEYCEQERLWKRQHDPEFCKQDDESELRYAQWRAQYGEDKKPPNLDKL